MEDNHKPLIEHKRRLNPKIKEVVKKETPKLLKASTIYLISDNKWLSLVHVVPRKGCIMVTKNMNELVPIRNVTS